MRSTDVAYLAGSSIVSHGLTAPSANTDMPSNQPSSSSWAIVASGSGSGVANASTAQYTPVLGSYSPRVAGESNTGGRNACRVRSPASNDSPSATQRHRSSGKSKQVVCRSTIAQLQTSVAFG